MSTIITNLFLLFTFLFLFQTTCALSKRCHPEDERILLQIKKEFNNPPILSSWTPNTDCCNNWNGVACSALINERVDYISIWNDTNLSSQFPPSIGHIPNLEVLFLGDLPNLTGPFPHFITKRLTKLVYLTITSTGLTGPIPNFTEQFTNLVNLDLSHNNLYGTLPPLLYKLPSLSSVFLNNNKLTGSIPPTWGYFNNSNVAGLVSLNVSYNRLCGEIPKTGYFKTLDVSSFIHNKCLCGSPLPTCN